MSKVKCHMIRSGYERTNDDQCILYFQRYHNLNTFKRMTREYSQNPQNEYIKFAICPAL